MGYLDGHSTSSETSQKDDKGDKGDRGIGFSLTADQHYHLQNNRLTNVVPPVDYNDATTKKKNN